MADYTVTVTPPAQYAVTTTIGGKPKTNFVATTAPATTDDSGAGYTVGSVWCDVTNDLAYICLDSTDDAAVWTKISVPSVVSQAEAEAGVATTERIWTAERVAQAIAALGGGGGGVAETVTTISFRMAPNDTVEWWLRIPPSHEMTRVEILHRDPSGSPAVPTGGTVAMSKETAGSNQFTAASITLSSLTGPNSVLSVTTVAHAGDSTLLHATAGNRQYVQGDRLKVTVVNLDCADTAELYISIVTEPI